MSNIFECTGCGKRWVVYVGEGSKCIACNSPLKRVDDGPPAPKTATLEEVRKILEEDDE